MKTFSDFQTVFRTEAGKTNTNREHYTFVEKEGLGCWILAEQLDTCEDKESAKLAAEQLVQDFSFKPAMVRSKLREYMKNAHDRLVKESINQKTTLKANLVMVVSNYSSFIWAVSGNARLYHFRSGAFNFRSKDQSMAQVMLDAGNMEEFEVNQRNERNALINYVGISTEYKPHVSQIYRLADGDQILLCSAGLWEKLSQDEIAPLLKDPPDPVQSLAKLQEQFLSKQGKGAKNYLAALIQINRIGSKQWFEIIEPRVLKIAAGVLAATVILTGLISAFSTYRPVSKNRVARVNASQNALKRKKIPVLPTQKPLSTLVNQESDTGEGALTASSNEPGSPSPKPMQTQAVQQTPTSQTAKELEEAAVATVKQQETEELRRRKAMEELQRKRTAEELRKQQEAELQKKREAEVLRKQQETEGLRKQQEAVELQKQRVAEELRKQKRAEEQRKQREAAELHKQKEAEELWKQREVAELRKQKEAEELRKQQEAVELRKQQEAEELQKQQAAELRKQKKAEEQQKKRDAAELRKLKEAEELRKQQEAAELRKQQEAEELQKQQAAEELRKQKRAEEQQKKRDAAELRKQKKAEEQRKQREVEEQQRQKEAEEFRKQKAVEEAQKQKTVTETGKTSASGSSEKGKSEPSDQVGRVEQARAWENSGDEKYKAAKYAVALELYKKAYRVYDALAMSLDAQRVDDKIDATIKMKFKNILKRPFQQ